MKTVVPYERRGHLYRELTICNHRDAAIVAQMFREETNVWLRKLLAEKLNEVYGIYYIDVPETDIREAIGCQVK